MKYEFQDNQIQRGGSSSLMQFFKTSCKQFIIINKLINEMISINLFDSQVNLSPLNQFHQFNTHERVIKNDFISFTPELRIYFLQNTSMIMQEQMTIPAIKTYVHARICVSNQQQFYFKAKWKQIIKYKYNQFYQMTLEYSPNNFITKFYSILKNKNFERIIKYDELNAKIYIFDKEKLESEILPYFFRHNKFTSLIRQLNHYGFKKIKNGIALTFTHPTILSGKSFLQIIRRKKAHVQESGNEQNNQNQQEQAPAPTFQNYNGPTHQQQILENHDRRVISQEIHPPSDALHNTNSENREFVMPVQQNIQLVTYLVPFSQLYRSKVFIGYFQY